MKSAILIGVLFFFPVTAPAVEWAVDTTADNQVRFVATASSFIKSFDFEGKTDEISGHIEWQDNAPSENNSFSFTVNVESFQTGNGKRDRDMREHVLETDRYPTVTFEGRITDFSEIDTLQNGFEVTTTGTLTLHGEEKEVKIPGILELNNGQARIRAEFDVELSDYNISRPSILIVKVQETVHLNLDFYMRKK